MSLHIGLQGRGSDFSTMTFLVKKVFGVITFLKNFSFSTYRSMNVKCAPIRGGWFSSLRLSLSLSLLRSIGWFVSTLLRKSLPTIYSFSSSLSSFKAYAFASSSRGIANAFSFVAVDLDGVKDISFHLHSTH